MRSNVAQGRRRLLVLTNVFPSERNPGLGIYVYEQVRRLAGRYDLSVVYGRAVRRFWLSSPMHGRDDFRGIQVYRVAYPAMPKFGVYTSGRAYYRILSRLLPQLGETARFDLVLAYWTYPDGEAAGRIAQDFDVPLLLRPRGSDINKFLGRPLLAALARRALSKAASVMPNSHDMQKKIEALHLRAKVHTLHNGVDCQCFYPLPKAQVRRQLGLGAPDERIVLFAGRFDRVKGIRYLLRAIRILDRIEHRGLRFVFVGDGPELDAIRRTSLRLNHVRISVVGAVPQDRLRAWLSAADVSCLPSLSEGCPNVVLESLACGTPVVASNVGGIPELLNSEHVGLLFPARDPDAAAAKIVAALERRWDAAQLAQRVAGQSWDAVAARLSDECDRLLRVHAREKNNASGASLEPPASLLPQTNGLGPAIAPAGGADRTPMHPSSGYRKDTLPV